MRRRSRSRQVRRFGAIFSVAAFLFRTARRVVAALSLRSVRRLRRRSRSRSARRGAALPLAHGSPRCGCGALARARFAALRRRSRSRPVRRVAVAALSLRSVRRVAVAALPLTLGSPLGAALPLRSARRVAALPFALGSPLGAAVSGGGKGSLCDLLGGALAHARFADSGGAPARARLAASGRCSRSRPGGFYLINIYLNIIINQSRRRREAPAFRTAKKYAPSGGVFPLSDIYFCFAYSAIALYFSKSSGRRMRALAGLVEGSSMHGMQPQGSQNRL